MASGGDASEETASGKASQRPIYDGKSSTWPETKIIWKNYINRKGWDKVVFTTKYQAKPIMSARYYVCRDDGEGWSEVAWSPREILTAIEKGEIEPIRYLVAPDGSADWQQLVRVLPSIRDQASGKGIVDMCKPAVTPKDVYLELQSLISHTTKNGAGLPAFPKTPVAANTRFSAVPIIHYPRLAKARTDEECSES